MGSFLLLDLAGYSFGPVLPSASVWPPAMLPETRTLDIDVIDKLCQ